MKLMIGDRVEQADDGRTGRVMAFSSSSKGDFWFHIYWSDGAVEVREGQEGLRGILKLRPRSRIGRVRKNDRS